MFYHYFVAIASVCERSFLVEDDSAKKTVFIMRVFFIAAAIIITNLLRSKI